jgi:hypothetical protein
MRDLLALSADLEAAARDLRGHAEARAAAAEGRSVQEEREDASCYLMNRAREYDQPDGPRYAPEIARAIEMLADGVRRGLHVGHGRRREREALVRRMRASGSSLRVIASAVGMGLQQVRFILGLDERCAEVPQERGFGAAPAPEAAHE